VGVEHKKNKKNKIYKEYKIGYRNDMRNKKHYVIKLSSNRE
jgi:hypothetical protein